MIVVALGSNRHGPWGSPRAAVQRVLAELDRGPTRLVAASRLLVSAPFGRLNQGAFVNAVCVIDTHLPPEALLRRLHALERAAGRRRGSRWGPRSLDLDLIDYHGLRRRPPSSLALPHPGIAQRIFVLKPLAEIAPGWRHPLLKVTAAELLQRLTGTRQGAEI
ncbi:MAG: 2-amino-4-hydroxy-6-hydroxymethyldihydropteridine diphosphokinase [Rhizobiales bacterium]|nr:2-amino-4-hydroxy-6-hydroxymethyldihydropteridine diphosphokinase [Hyphomicrobiales bacterium]MBI3673219.1 2-amino-4-hydroxy-6-hydroxymethyldihydropteridine diphosphokinase [Hyphomicrobiales bacterium]